MQIALRHLQECFYMQSSEMMLAYKISTNIQTHVELKTILILVFCLSLTWLYSKQHSHAMFFINSLQGPKN